jgi:hypothetical protein
VEFNIKRVLMMEATVEKVLEEAAQACEAASPQRKERVPKETKVREPKATKEPKVKLYVQWNEDGTPMLDAEGNRVKGPVKMARPKSASAGTRAPKFAKDAVITLLVQENPKRAGSASHARFENYKSGMTVEQALAAGLISGDFTHDVAHGFIRIE